jgi:hypothetical protein
MHLSTYVYETFFDVNFESVTVINRVFPSPTVRSRMLRCITCTRLHIKTSSGEEESAILSGFRKYVELGNPRILYEVLKRLQIIIIIIIIVIITIKYISPRTVPLILDHRRTDRQT